MGMQQNVVIFTAAVFCRSILFLYGEYQDAHYSLKFTDVDYKVFTDASDYISRGKSPYQRETYRYTPILAIMLLPNIWLFHSFGKLLFSVFDLLTAHVLIKYLEGK